MSSFTELFRDQSRAAWGAAGAWLTKYGQWQDERRKRSLGQKGGSGCLGFLLFGFIYFFIPIMIVLGVEIVVVAYALLASALYGIGAAVDGLRPRANRQGVKTAAGTAAGRGATTTPQSKPSGATKASSSEAEPSVGAEGKPSVAEASNSEAEPSAGANRILVKQCASCGHYNEGQPRLCQQCGLVLDYSPRT